MIKTKELRKVNRNLFYSKLALYGLSLETLGQQLTPPIRKVRVHNIITAGKPYHRLREISKVLKSNVATLFPKVTPREDGKDAA